MDVDILGQAFTALGIVFEPERFAFLILGVALGLAIGIIPGLSGIVGLSLLLPFTWDMDPYTALSFLMGLLAVVTTADTIPTVLFGVPGTVGSAATIMDGFPMAKQGKASRAFGAAFSASVMGGLFGAFLLAASVPVLRQLILGMGTPDQLAFCIFGLSVAAILAGGSPLKGLAGVCLGLMIATAGDDPQTGTLRWTFNALYLWDGLGVVPLALGLFAIPEIADLVIARRKIQGDVVRDSADSAGQMEGVRDSLKHWWLVLRCGAIGAGLGAIPGIGASVVDWVAYGHAARTEKGAAETFGTGDVRGVIASESSNNAKEGGALLPTIGFGVPGSASMTLIVAAFMIHGLVPGPEMLSTKLDVTFTLVWSIAIANVIGGGVCFLCAGQLARIALIRIGILAPVVLVFVYIGAFQGSHQWGDIYALLAFGVLGWVMKRLRWPRPPLMLGFVLGEVVERYMFISYELYEWGWLMRPLVLVLFAITLYGVFRPILRDRAARRLAGGAVGVSYGFRRDKVDGGTAFTVIVLFIFVLTLVVSSEWEFGARLVPQVVGWFGVFFAAALLFKELFTTPAEAPAGSSAAGAASGAAGFHFDNVMDFGDLSRGEINRRAAVYFAWCAGLLIGAAIIGLLPAVILFLIAYMRIAGRESWTMTLSVAAPLAIGAYILFHNILHMPWPLSVVGRVFPALNTFQSLSLF
jgi:TctA family transporter